MECTKVEIASIQEIIVQAPDTQVRELNELQLAFVGGGIVDMSTI